MGQSSFGTHSSIFSPNYSTAVLDTPQFLLFHQCNPHPHRLLLLFWHASLLWLPLHRSWCINSNTPTDPIHNSQDNALFHILLILLFCQCNSLPHGLRPLLCPASLLWFPFHRSYCIYPNDSMNPIHNQPDNAVLDIFWFVVSFRCIYFPHVPLLLIFCGPSFWLLLHRSWCKLPKKSTDPMHNPPQAVQKSSWQIQSEYNNQISLLMSSCLPLG